MTNTLRPDAEALVVNALVENFTSMTPDEIEASYRTMAADQEREAEALEWAEGTLGHPVR